MDMDKLGAAMAPVLAAMVAKAVDPLQERIKELEGREVIHGKDADPVSDEAIAAAVAKHLTDHPPANGKDAIGPTADDVAACFERRFSEFLLSGERRIYEMADKAIDRMPRAQDGKDGVDGIGWDSMSVDHDGERTFTLVFDKGDEQHTFPVKLPMVIDKGFWQDGTSAEQGDGFTFGGSYWIAQKDTDTKPEIGNADWRLAVRRGRDGKRTP